MPATRHGRTRAPRGRDDGDLEGLVGWQRMRAWMEVFSSADSTSSCGPSAGPASGGRTRPAPRAALSCGVGVAREGPRAVGPGADGVTGQPAPDGGAGDLGADAVGDHLGAQVRHTCSRDKGTPRRAGRSQARALTAATTTTTTTTSRGSAGGRPPRGRSANPASRCSWKRYRHFDTIWRGVSSRAAISSLPNPSAAYSTILALMTSGTVTYSGGRRPPGVALVGAQLDLRAGSDVA
jgi:hypothetical protein